MTSREWRNQLGFCKVIELKQCPGRNTEASNMRFLMKDMCMNWVNRLGYHLKVALAFFRFIKLFAWFKTPFTSVFFFPSISNARDTVFSVSLYTPSENWVSFLSLLNKSLVFIFTNVKMFAVHFRKKSIRSLKKSWLENELASYLLVSVFELKKTPSCWRSESSKPIYQLAEIAALETGKRTSGISRITQPRSQVDTCCASRCKRRAWNLSSAKLKLTEGFGKRESLRL